MKIEYLKSGKARYGIIVCDEETGERKTRYSYLPAAANKKQHLQMSRTIDDIVREKKARGLTRVRVMQWAEALCTILEVEGPSIKELGVQWLLATNGNLSGATAVSRIQFMQHACAYKAFEDKPAASLELMDFEQWHRDLVDNGRYSHSTADRHLSTIRSLIDWAMAHDYVAVNRAKAVKPYGKKFQPQVKKPFTQDEVERLLEAADQPWKDIILLASLIGTAIGDTTGMLWESVDWKEKCLRFRRKKTKTRVIVPFFGRAYCVLDLRKKGSPEEEKCMFPTKCSMTAGELGVEFGAIMKKAGIDPGKGKKGVYEKSFHSLRYHAINRAVSAGIPEDVRMQIFGHISKDVHRNYGSYTVEQLRRHTDGLG